MEVSVRELKSRLSEYLRRAADGQEVVVTSHGKAIARLVAPSREDRTALGGEQLLARVRRMPGVRLGVGRPRLPAPRIRIQPGERTLADMIIEDRGW